METKKKNFIRESELLPSHYKKVGEPSYQGKGNHSVSQLEDICEQYKELVHQLRVSQNAIVEKFKIQIASNGETIYHPDGTVTLASNYEGVEG